MDSLLQLNLTRNTMKRLLKVFLIQHNMLEIHRYKLK
jgi:hypothetical protein